MQIPFLGQSYAPRSGAADCQRTINWYPELNQADSKSVISLVGTPGTFLFSHALGTPVRGMHVFNGLLYCVAGGSLFSISSNGLASLPIAALNTAAGRVYMVDNGVASAGIGGDQLAIVDGLNLYIYDVVTNAFSVVPGITTPKGIAYLDGYFIMIDGSMSARASDLYNGLTWNTLATSPVSSSSGNIVAVAVLHQQLWFIKEYTSEVWYNTGTPTSQGFPFLRISGAVINYGTKAPATLAQGANSLFFLAWERNGDAGEFVGMAQMNGYAPAVVSSAAINYRISKLPGASSGHSDAFGYFYSDEGHSFYVATFPAGDATFAYDVTTQMCHERSTLRLSLPAGYSFSLDADISLTPPSPIVTALTASLYDVHRHVSNCYVFFDNKHLVGDWESGNVYEMSSSYFQDNGLDIVSVRVAQHVWDKKDLGNVMIHKLQIDAETGVGEVTNELRESPGYLADGTYSADGTIYAGAKVVSIGDVNPMAILSWSSDGGHTWSGDYRASIGTLGAYKTRLIWRRLGRSRDRVFRLAMTHVLKRNIVGAYLEATG